MSADLAEPSGESTLQTERRALQRVGARLRCGLRGRLGFDPVANLRVGQKVEKLLYFSGLFWLRSARQRRLTWQREDRTNQGQQQAPAARPQPQSTQGCPGA